MSLLISPRKCPECGAKSIYFVSCDKCGWVDQEFLDREEKRAKQLRKLFKKWRDGKKIPRSILIGGQTNET